MEDTYLTLARQSEGSYKEKGSKFLAFAYPVNSEEDIKEYLANLKKKYFDARHHCYAYILDQDQSRFRANDDGEPNHSAGDPILGQIRSNNLTNVLIVVVRYFGGTKLGVGGLINAYRTAAVEAIDNNQIVQKVVKILIRINFDYLQMNEVMKLVKDYNLEIRQQEFDNRCNFSLLVRLKQKEELTEKLKKIATLQMIQS
ncbi:YigZ family protein [Fulvivirgaceae bacterium BMA10]|uniref:YigZ family protein n=1 Tax=Splendidivirga corallicola TaxID=3051826 RepID=A0ABT8KRI5_9BACT|nr:YigZ family protein [Fulvivirgaceae bacterium BMA10]